MLAEKKAWTERPLLSDCVEKVGPSELPAYWLLKTIVDATLIAVPPSTKNKVKKRA